MGADGQIPLLFYAAGFLALLSVPAAAVGFAMVFDRIFQGRSSRLGVVAIVLATVASAAILVLSLRSASSAPLAWIVPPAVTAVPVLLQILLGDRRSQGAAGALLGLTYLASLAVLVGLMFLLAASLVGFSYLPSIAALAVAALRASRPESGHEGHGRREATWLTPLLLLCVPVLAATTWYVAGTQTGSTPGQLIQRGGEIEVRISPTPRPAP